MASTAKDLWSLRPGDLPSKSMLGLAPELRGLENNAFYRLLLWQSRRAGATASELIDIAGALLTCAFMFGAISGIRPSLTTPLFLASGLLLLLRAVRKNRRLRAEAYTLWPLPDRAIQDLCQCGLGSGDLLLALWGASLSPSRLLAVNSIFGLAGFGAIVGLFCWPFEDAARLILLLLIMAAAAGARHALQPDPSEGLQRVLHATAKIAVRYYPPSQKGKMLLFELAIGAVATAIVLGLWLSGSPYWLRRLGADRGAILTAEIALMIALGVWAGSPRHNRKRGGGPGARLKLERHLALLLNRITARATENPYPDPADAGQEMRQAQS